VDRPRAVRPSSEEERDGRAPSGGGRPADTVLSRPFVVLWVCGCVHFLAMGMVNPLLPRFVKDTLDKDDLVVGVVVALLAASAVVMRPVAGQLATKRGRRPVMVVGAAVNGLSFLLYAVPHLAVLVSARLVTGVGHALFVTGSHTMVTEVVSERRRAEAVSYFSVAIYLALGVGPAIGEAVARRWTIGWAFAVAGLVSAMAALVSRRTVETVQAAADAGEAAEPTRRISRAALLPGCVLAFGMVASVAFGSFMPLYADELGMAGAASVYVVYSAVVILVRLFGARLPDVLGPARCGTIATVVIAVGMAGIAASGTSWGLYVGAVTLAIGISFLYPSLTLLVVACTPARERALAMGTFTMFMDVASGLGGMMLGVVANAAGYRAAFSAAAISAAGGLVILQLLLLRARPAPAPSTP